MKALDSLIARLKTFESEFIKVIEKAVKDNEKEILALNYQKQLYDQGIDRNGEKLKPPYAESTVRIKKKKSQITGHVTLRDENIFHRSFYIYYGPDNFQIMTTDPIEGILTWRYGEAIIGLTDENLRYVIEKFIAPAISAKLKTLK